MDTGPTCTQTNMQAKHSYKETSTLSPSRLQCCQSPGHLPAPVRHSGDHGKRLFVVKPSLYYDARFLRLMKFYLMLTGIPVIIGITLVNIFIASDIKMDRPEFL
ncbi:NADH dehydrogenase (ubiquinone) 1 beta subcomplex, 5, isoform CRA_c [Mus musculus]|nr:NADH dehydrogenase (ubiquinone) 1 beta subcomplex, 5, isoform CRA_c [Mus musculus]